jgi:hypothetical protein
MILGFSLARAFGGRRYYQPDCLHKNLPVIEVTDPSTLDDLYADPRSVQYLLTQLGPR